jgi:hypothetical protein
VSRPQLEQIGNFREAPSPRFGVAIFAFPREQASVEAAYSPEWTARIVNRLDWNHLSAVAVGSADRTVTEDVEKAGADLGRSLDAKAIDVLLVGTILPGGNAQARLALFDPGSPRSAGGSGFFGRSEFEGGNDEAVVYHAVDEAIAKVNHYWVELRRGEDAEARLEVSGLQSPGDIPTILEKLAAIPNVHVTRHESTAMAAGSAAAGYHLYFQGDPESLLKQAALVQWKSGSQSVRLTRLDALHFKAVYE